MRPRRILVALSALALAGIGAASPWIVTRATTSSDSPAPALSTSWTEMVREPCALRGFEVRFTIQFHGLPARWQAGATRFGPGAFAAVDGWADEQRVWLADEFDSPAVRCFVRRGSELERTFASARTHQRFELRGVVREIWRGRPWIEVHSATPLAEEVGEATVFHAGRAVELIGDGSFVLADQALEVALSAPLPDAARAELGRLRDLCAVEIANPKPAPIRPRRR